MTDVGDLGTLVRQLQGGALRSPTTGMTGVPFTPGSVRQPNLKRATLVIASTASDSGGGGQTYVLMDTSNPPVTRIALSGPDAASVFYSHTFIVPAGCFYQIFASAGAIVVADNTVFELTL